VRTWTGAVSTDWSNGANWSPVGVVPADVDSVLIPFPVPNYPTLVANTDIGGVEVADQATLSLSSFNLNVGANVATGYTLGSGILGTSGVLVLVGTAAPANTVEGRVPKVLVTGSYALSDDLFVVAPGRVRGKLASQLHNIRITAQ
jgi:hypothetical protein